MNRSAWQIGIFFTLLIVLMVGCDERQGFTPAGVVVEMEEEPGTAAPVDADRQWDRDAERPPVDADREKPRSDDRFSFGSRQSDQSESMPSRTERWGADRRMPSDSMPSESMPSRTERWGADRRMPSESMPSESESWGADRRMPSDSMPSQSFDRGSDSSR